MKIDVTFEQTDMALQPAFDVIIPMDISTASVQGILDGTLSGRFFNDKVTGLKFAAFYNCKNLVSVSLPNCACLDGEGQQFDFCERLQEVSLPNLATINRAYRTFNGLRNLKEISLPNLTTANNMEMTFAMCTAVTNIRLPKLGGTTIKRYAFRYCYYLHTLVFGGDSLNTLENTNAFENAGIHAENGLRIYVPDTLVDTYKRATNWSVYADKIKPISELEA